MTTTHTFEHAVHDVFHAGVHPIRQSMRHVTAMVVIAIVCLAASIAFAPPSAAEQLDSYIAENAQTIIVATGVDVPEIARETYTATPGIATLAAGGTNHDWAKLVLLFGEFPMTETNVTVITRWMRQENGPPDWFNRNNPLNNGWGSGGGGGLGTYDSLITAAENAAKALHGNPGYGYIVAALNASESTGSIEQAIWASPWATGHYNNGAHWSSAPVPVVTAPASSW
ncbi:MAG: hypothetical protein ACOH1J_02410 [Microbacteriaceae bacterium]